METNIPFNHTLLVYDISADDFGDPTTVGEPHTVKASLENTDGWENDNYADRNTGTITCQIMPDDPYYVAQGGKLHGKLAQFNRYGETAEGNWYRIASVRPGESLYDSTPDFVELTLARTMPRDQAEG